MSAADDQVLKRYRRKYRLPRAMFGILNGLLVGTMLTGQPSRHAHTFSPARILLANAGHIGDLLMMMFTIPLIRARFPDAKVDLLAGSWAEALFRDTNLVDEVIALDHWNQDRSPSSLAAKLHAYFSNARRVARSLSQGGYDVAIDVRMWFPNYAFVLWMARIPIRAGFGGLNLGAYLTNPAPIEFSRRHEVEVQFDLLRRVFGEPIPATPATVPAQILRAVDSGKDEVRALLGDKRVGVRVLHVGTTTPVREWRLERWRALTEDLLERGITPVFTGRGVGDARLIAEITHGLSGCISGCDRLSWSGLVTLINCADLVYSTETSVGHLAAALGRPVVALYGGTADPQRWKPYGSQVRVVTNPVPCSPCLRKHGCSTLACIKGIPVPAVQRAAEMLAEAGK